MFSVALHVKVVTKISEMEEWFPINEAQSSVGPDETARMVVNRTLKV